MVQAAIVRLHSRQTDRNLPDGMEAKEDEFSIQVAASDDPLFWLRVERGNSATVKVSDLKRSQSSDERIASALAFAVSRATDAGPVRQLVFLDIIPAHRGAGSASEVARGEAALISRAVVQYVRLEGLRVARVELSARQNKVDLCVDLIADQPERAG